VPIHRRAGVKVTTISLIFTTINHDSLGFLEDFLDSIVIL
jgi:hypothetical protein